MEESKDFVDPPIDFKIWFEKANDDLSILGEKKIELLEAVGKKGSIKAAAEACGIDYKLAWEMIDNANKRVAPKTLVDSKKGGGGGTTLTHTGLRLIERYKNVKQLIEKVLPHIIDGYELDIDKINLDEKQVKKLNGRKKVFVIPLDED